jgi:hypothetical protein
MGVALEGQAANAGFWPKTQRKPGAGTPAPSLRQPLFGRAGGPLFGLDLRRRLGLGSDRGELAVAIGGDLP